MANTHKKKIKTKKATNKRRIISLDERSIATSLKTTEGEKWLGVKFSEYQIEAFMF